jgi:hypothetical protein
LAKRESIALRTGAGFAREEDIARFDFSGGARGETS